MWLYSDCCMVTPLAAVRGCCRDRQADYEGLAPLAGHVLRLRGLWLSRRDKVGELADLVHLHAGPLAA
jgi:hypothetical protein